ncbi:hypothetical protein X798_06528 [Onchocerca flexuosa]|uniref:Uncharacterized protein n=1 Tax=Onchocerca flexuosa TaxID=387005 RepID=A0A238BM50_9BILA|nr:hypothetical protein X798_06528 [Onchocerca flexuosa]
MNGGDLDFQNYMSKLDAGGADMPDLEDVDDKEGLDEEAETGAAAKEEKKDKVEAGDKKEEVVELNEFMYASSPSFSAQNEVSLLTLVDDVTSYHFLD